MAQQRFYPIGIQTFSEIREGNYLYIDKTEYVYRMTHCGTKYMFLSRPRRFGKSLLTSTLHSYFDGQKELFKGLAMEGLETEWVQYPVLHFDLSRVKDLDVEGVKQSLSAQLHNYEKTYGKEDCEMPLGDRLASLIGRACQQTGKKTVVLIDEYDAPLLDVLHDRERLSQLRSVLRNFYSPLKSCDPYLRFVFITGISKFSQLTLFSGLNNIKNISMDKKYAAICGITEEEMLVQMDSDIEVLADELEITKDEAVGKLKEMYDGYHFTWPSPDIYNPFSLMNAFADGEIQPYWFGTGTSSYLIEMLRKYNVKPSQIGGVRVSTSSFDVPLEDATGVIPLLYQSGYVTIKAYNNLSGLYTLDIPNKEIKVALYDSLLPHYLDSGNQLADTVVGEMRAALLQDNMDEMLGLLQTFLGTVPYTNNTDYEGHWQQVLYIIFTLLGERADVEVHTASGRVDVVVRTGTTLYLIEVKLNKSAEAAAKQIDLKDYASRFALCGLPVVKVGVNFDSERHSIESWQVER